MLAWFLFQWRKISSDTKVDCLQLKWHESDHYLFMQTVFFLWCIMYLIFFLSKDNYFPLIFKNSLHQRSLNIFSFQLLCAIELDRLYYFTKEKSILWPALSNCISCLDLWELSGTCLYKLSFKRICEPYVK